jgi:DUF4097 and DUF4098 domain-containing protein YvlB
MDMNCLNHPETPATAFCRTCGKPLCDACKRQVQGTVFCAEHAPPVTATPPAPAPVAPPPVADPNVSPGLAFALGLIVPGVGAIYNGQYAKGLVHAIIWGLLLSITTSGSAGNLLPLFIVLIVAWVFYMAIEAYQTALKRRTGQPVDEFSSLVNLHARGAGFPGGAVVLIVLGVLLLLNTMDILPLDRILRYWPVLLILWGIAKLIDHFAANKSGGHRPPFLTGQEAALLVLVVLVLIAMWAAENIFTRGRREHAFDVDIFSRSYSENREISLTQIPPGAQIRIETRRGNITIHAGEGNELRAEASLSAPGMSESGAREKMKDIRVAVDKSASSYILHAVGPDTGERTEVSFDVELPKRVNVAASSSRGDIAITGLAGNVAAESHSGDIEIHEITGDIALTVGSGDARVSDIQGNTRVSGKGNEVEVSDIAGDASVEGDFFGPIRLRNVRRTTHFASMSSNLTLLHLTGQLELDSGQIEISDVGGAAKLVTHNKDIEVENVAGPLDIAGSHGDIKVRFSEPPREGINIANDSGDVELTLPSKSSFEISAVSRSGDIESEFEDPGLQPVNEKGSGQILGKFGSRGPKISITTTYGTIYLRRSS